MTTLLVIVLIAPLSNDFSHHLLMSQYHRYKRIFSIGSKAVTTYNPVSLEVTNQVSLQLYVSFVSFVLMLDLQQESQVPSPEARSGPFICRNIAYISKEI